MKPILVQVDSYTARLLDEVVPGRSRKRSKFIRDAVLRALMDVVEVKTRRAYARAGHEPDAWHFDPTEWAPQSEAIHRPGSHPEVEHPRRARSAPALGGARRREARARR